MKTLLVILDGLGDLPNPNLKNKTPLAAAVKPFLDKISQNCMTGSVEIAGKIAPESDVGVLSILGFNPFKRRIGRGFLEALGAGLKFENGDLALRANFATSDENGSNILDRRAGRNLSTSEAKLLEKEINSKVKLENATFEFKATIAHRAAIVFKAKKGLNFSHEITNTDPAYLVGRSGVANALKKFDPIVALAKPWLGKEKKTGAINAAAVVNEFTKKVHHVLQRSSVNKKRISENKRPANIVLMRDAESKAMNLKPFKNWSIIAEYPLELGISKLLGMKVLPATPGTSVKDYKKRAELALKSLKNSNVYVHLKGPDLFGHDGDAIGKKKSIEDIDTGFFSQIVKKFGFSNNLLVITADHSTPCIKKSHSNDSVPLLVAGKEINGTPNFFDDEHCRKQKLKLKGWDVLKEFNVEN